MRFLITILPLLVSLFWFFALLFNRDKSKANPFTFALIVFTSIIYFCHALFFNHQYHLYSIFESLWVFASLMVYPMLYFQVHKLTSTYKLANDWIYHSIPPLFLALITGTLYVLMSPEETEAFVQGVLYMKEGYESESLLVDLQKIRIQFFQILLFAQVVVSLYFGLRSIFAYRKEIRSFYSNVGGRDLMAVQMLLIFFTIISALSLISSVLGKQFFIANPQLLVIPSVLFAGTIFMMVMILYRQCFGIEVYLQDKEEYEMKTYLANLKRKESVRESGLSTKTAVESLQDQIENLLKINQVFKNNDLRITDLAIMLNTNRAHVSRVISENFGTNFSDLINTHRVNYAENLLKQEDPEDLLRVVEIAMQSGFASESSFYRIFKSKTGMSPVQYRNNWIQEEASRTSSPSSR